MKKPRAVGDARGSGMKRLVLGKLGRQINNTRGPVSWVCTYHNRAPDEKGLNMTTREISLTRDPLYRAAVHPQPNKWVRENRNEYGYVIVDKHSCYYARRTIRAMCYAAEKETDCFVDGGWRFANAEHMDPHLQALCFSDAEGRILAMILLNDWDADFQNWSLYAAYCAPAWRENMLLSLLCLHATNIYPGQIIVEPQGMLGDLFGYRRAA